MKKGDPSFRGEIIDGVYIGEFPGPTAGAINSRGKTLYEIKLADSAAQILAEEDIEKRASDNKEEVASFRCLLRLESL